jgi:hypothetical protein
MLLATLGLSCLRDGHLACHLMNDLATQYLCYIPNLGKKEKKEKRKKQHHFLLHHRKQALVFIVYNYHPLTNQKRDLK